MFSFGSSVASRAGIGVGCGLILFFACGCPMPGDPLSSPPRQKVQPKKLESAPPECLEISRKTLGGYPQFSDAAVVDVDSDGRMELVVPAVRASINILDLSGKPLERIKLQTQTDLSSDVRSVVVGGQTHWMGVFRELKAGLTTVQEIHYVSL